jgi:diguanylate cyclase (GGDEF)-like protein
MPISLHSLWVSVAAGVLGLGLLAILFRHKIAAYRRWRYRSRTLACDPLTNLFLRRAFEEVGGHEFDSSERQDFPLAVFLVSIDDLRQINNRHGRAIGDFVLRSVAGALRRSMRPEDFVCRWAGDRFCAMLPMTSRADAEKVAERSLQAIEAIEILVDGKRMPVEVSVGIASREDAGRDFGAMVKLAAGSLGQAKAVDRAASAVA